MSSRFSILGQPPSVDEFSANVRINPYEKGKHSVYFSTANHLATQLKTPTSFLYKENDDITAMLQLYDSLNDSEYSN